MCRLESGSGAPFHRDLHNSGATLARAVGSFQGGGLLTWAFDGRPDTQPAKRLNLKGQTVVFDGRAPHAVQPFTGADRFSIIAYMPDHVSQQYKVFN